MPPKLPFRYGDLHPDFAERIRQLVWQIGLEGLPLDIGEGKRSLERQCWAINNGGSSLKDPTWGRHTAGFAVDFRLKRNYYQSIGKYPLYMGFTKDRSSIVHEAANIWLRFGELVKSIDGLRWGGDFGYHDNPNQMIGWDPYHVELTASKGFMKGGHGFKCMGNNPVEKGFIENAITTSPTDEDAPVEEAAPVTKKAAKSVLGSAVLAAGAYMLYRRAKQG